MNQNERYQSAKEIYAKIGVDTEAALAKLQETRISMHCWQADDVRGFEGTGTLSGGIQTTGNYPGGARNPDEVFADLDKALSLIPGTHKINVHANYAIAEPGETIDRDTIEPRHFKRWVEFAKAHHCGLDFNPTFFSHPKASGLTLSSPNEEIRQFWIRHGIACIRIAEYFANETGYPCVMNIWTGDGSKDVPADRLGPRMRYADSIDQILACGYDKSKVYVTVESKVFGIGVEAYTVGSAEFALSYAMTRGITPLMDNGHYHPTEVVSDKIPALLVFNDKIALHITRPIRWDSDHVVAYDDETREMMKEVVRCNALDRVFLATDYFDASINRVGALVIGMRNVQKALLNALLTPNEDLKKLQDEGNNSKLLMLQEEYKLLPLGDVWNEFCARNNVPACPCWYKEIEEYEKNVLSLRK
jgi:L-rhamnose isomerase